MENVFLNIAIRQQALFIPENMAKGEKTKLTQTTALLVANLAKLGFGVTETLLSALNNNTPTQKVAILEAFRKLMGVDKNWTPLVKGWDTPTGETRLDHIITFFANVFKAEGTRLACGHIIPNNTFPLERYNGCPFCGTPFEFGKLGKIGQGSRLKVLELWTESDIMQFFRDLLQSKTPLDATQLDSLRQLLKVLPLPAVEVGMKETLMEVVDTLLAENQADKAQILFKSPTDILRYLWFKHTGFLQIIEPKTLVKRKAANQRHVFAPLDNSAKAKYANVTDLKLKYDRKMCLTVATWLNALPLEADKVCEMMHPKRGMWVRFIRALRLPEYSQRKGFEQLRLILDYFYNQVYEVWQGEVNRYRLRTDAQKTFALLKQRPGLFARSLFANMLWFGEAETTAAFSEVLDKIPARLMLTLNMYAENYFNPRQTRAVKPLGGVTKSIAPNSLLSLYGADELEGMKTAVQALTLLAMEQRFAAIPNKNKTIYIDPILYNMPLSIGDRSENVQDLPSALMGTRFAVEGDKVRLFMQWGVGLPAQHLDMDLSCHIAFENRLEICSYGNLVATGCKHSGDIRSIPEKVGTAEYIEINLTALQKAGAKYVTFTCNAYSNGSLSPNMVVGWMNSRFPMKISEKTGVAYDPSCVQHQVRVTSGLSKGLVFGVLAVASSEVIWLEMPFSGQVVQGLSFATVQALLSKLEAKLSIGNLLAIKAKAQKLVISETPEADENYTQKWAMNTAAVTQLLVD